MNKTEREWREIDMNWWKQQIAIDREESEKKVRFLEDELAFLEAQSMRLRALRQRAECLESEFPACEGAVVDVGGSERRGGLPQGRRTR